MFKDKLLLITGGTGSFGNAVLNRLLDTDIGEIRIFSRDEKKQEDMRIRLANDKVKFFIGDVRDRRSIRPAMEGVDYVFHAAALKQVPSCEFYPMQAVKTNVMGAENVLDIAADAQVDRVIVLSTDKAVYPINAMGMSKAMMEKVAIAKARLARKGGTRILCTRYGNVMASRGSVIPLFVNQILAKQPLTVTDPEMTRFLMSLDEAVNLVVYAFDHGEQGDTFVKKAPACTISVLAQALTELFDSNSPVKVIGTRHGEKRYETLLTREEMAHASDREGYYRIPADNRDLNYGKFFVEGESQVTIAEDYNSDNTAQLDVEQVKDLLRKLDFIQNALKGEVIE